MSTDQLTRAVELLTGAGILFPEMEFGSLAESLQETLATGEASGTFAELIGRLGGDVEDFNTALKESPSLAGDVEIALAELAAGGLKDVTDEYKEANDVLTEAQELAAALELERTKLAGYMEEYITNPANEAQLATIEAANDLFEAYDQSGWGGVAGKAWEGFMKGGAWNMQQMQEKGLLRYGAETFAKILAGPLVSIPATIKGVSDAEAEKEAAEAAAEAARNDPRNRNMAIMAGITPEGAAESTETAEEAGKNDGKSYAEGFELSAADLQTMIDTYARSGMTPPTSLINEYVQKLEEEKKQLEEAAEEAGEAVVDGMESGTSGGNEAAAAAGAAFGEAYASGIMSQVSYVASAGLALAKAAADAMARAKPSGAGTYGPPAPGALYIDGRQAGTFLAPYVSEAMVVDVG
jgi:hypothetical protein